MAQFSVLEFSCLKNSRKTLLLHLGHFGSFSDTITYMKHRGQPTRSMAFVSGAFPPCTFSSSSTAIFDEYDTEEDDDDEENSGDVGLLCCLNSDPSFFVLHMMFNLFLQNKVTPPTQSYGTT